MYNIFETPGLILSFHPNFMVAAGIRLLVFGSLDLIHLRNSSTTRRLFTLKFYILVYLQAAKQVLLWSLHPSVQKRVIRFSHQDVPIGRNSYRPFSICWTNLQNHVSELAFLPYVKGVSTMQMFFWGLPVKPNPRNIAKTHYDRVFWTD